MADAFAITAGTALEYGLRMCAYLKGRVWRKMLKHLQKDNITSFIGTDIPFRSKGGHD